MINVAIEQGLAHPYQANEYPNGRKCQDTIYVDLVLLLLGKLYLKVDGASSGKLHLMV